MTAEKMTHQTLDYIRSIHQQGFRVTPQRQLILDAICEGRGHTVFEDICNRVWARSSSISLPTIYRNLRFLCQVRLVARLMIGSKTYYEIVGNPPNHHLICRKCGKVESLPHAEVGQFFETIKSKHGFSIDADHLGVGRPVL